MERPSTETTQVDAQSEEWFASYAEPSNQPADRHRHARRHRSQHRKRPRVDWLGPTMMILSVVFVGAMTACFYTVLTR